MIKLTERSKQVFLCHARDANHGGFALVDIGQNEKGNLSDLVKKGLIEIIPEDGESFTWMRFTKTGREYAWSHGVSIEKEESYNDFTR